MPTITQTITSDTDVVVEQTQTLNSSTEIVSDIFHTDFLSTVLLEKESSTDKHGSVVVTQTIPSAPTLSSATDLKIGDSVRLVWTGSGPFYNVYYKITGSLDSFTKANGFPLPSSQTQYDVGGLVLGTDYTFMVRGVNGAGTEGSDSNLIS